MPTITDINLEARDLCDASTTSYTAATLLRRINEAYEKVIGWILDADGTWQWDDTNYTKNPIGTQTLVDSQHPYSFNDKFLEISQVEVLDDSGDWHILKPIDESEITGDQPLDQLFEDDGLPEYYDKISDDTIKLYPAPDDGTSVTLANGLRIRYSRTASVYTAAEVTTGTKVPGFMSTAHYVLSYMAAIPYCIKYREDRVAGYMKMVDEYKKEITDRYAKRARDKRKKATFKTRAYK